MSSMNQQGCCFDPTEIIAAVDSGVDEVVERVGTLVEPVVESVAAFDFFLLMDALRTLSEQLSEQNKLLENISQQAQREIPDEH